MEDPGLYITLGLVNMGVDVADLEKAMDAEIAKVQNELISEKEFQKIRNQMESQFVQQNATTFGIAEQLANYHVYYKDANLINTEPGTLHESYPRRFTTGGKKYLVKKTGWYFITCLNLRKANRTIRKSKR